MQRFDETAPLQTEAWVEIARGEVTRTDVRGNVADGWRTILQLAVGLRPGSADAPAGSDYLALDHPLANRVIAALEPGSQNRYLANRPIDRLNAVRRVMARPGGVPVARQCGGALGPLGPGSRVCRPACRQILCQALASPQGFARSGLSAVCGRCCRPGSSRARRG